MRLALGIDRIGGFYAGVVRGIALYAHRQPGWHMDLHHPSQEGVRWLRARKPDAMILGALDPEMFAEVTDFGKPLVSVGFASREVPSVGNDNVGVGELACKHLLERGYRHFAYAPRIGMDLSLAKWLQNHLDARGSAFKDALARAGHTCHLLGEDCADGDSPSRESELERRFSSWLTGLPKPLGIFCETDELAWRVAQQCLGLGLEIPNDVAVLGVDNDPTICTLAIPPLSSVETASEQIGYEAAHLIRQLLDKQAVPEHIAVPPLRVFERRSTAAPLVDDEAIAKAMRYMQDNLQTEEGVAELSRRVGCSRRSFERRFVEATGSSPARTWLKFRIAEAQRLLSETQLSTEHIATLSGFTDGKTLSSTFRKYTGQSPTQFRKRLRPSAKMSI